MLKNISKLQIKIENKDYEFLCEPDSCLNHIKEALFQMLKFIGQVEDTAKVQFEQSKKEEEEKFKQLEEQKPPQE